MLAACEVGKELRTAGSPMAAAYLKDEKRRCMAMATAGVRQKFDEEYMQDEGVVILELHDKPAALNPPAPDPNQDAASGTCGHPGELAQRQELDQHGTGMEFTTQVAHARQPSTTAPRRSQRTNEGTAMKSGLSTSLKSFFIISPCYQVQHGGYN